MQWYMVLQTSCDALGYIISDCTWGPGVCQVFLKSYTLDEVTNQVSIGTHCACHQFGPLKTLVARPSSLPNISAAILMMITESGAAGLHHSFVWHQGSLPHSHQTKINPSPFWLKTP